MFYFCSNNVAFETSLVNTTIMLAAIYSMAYVSAGLVSTLSYGTTAVSQNQCAADEYLYTYDFSNSAEFQITTPDNQVNIKRVLKGSGWSLALKGDLLIISRSRSTDFFTFSRLHLFTKRAEAVTVIFYESNRKINEKYSV